MEDYALAQQALLRRTQAAIFLKERGYKIEKTTLDKKACVGGGPPFVKFARFPLYTPADLLAWAESQCSRKVSSTSELAIGSRDLSLAKRTS